MVTATKGVLINWYKLNFYWYIISISLLYPPFYSEPAVKEILLHLDSQHHFIIEDLDPTHVFVDPLQLDQIQEELRRILAENVYKAPQI